jgi:hypothetical protein
MLRQLRDVGAMLSTDPTLALPRIIADWGCQLLLVSWVILSFRRCCLLGEVG